MKDIRLFLSLHSNTSLLGKGQDVFRNILKDSFEGPTLKSPE